MADFYLGNQPLVSGDLNLCLVGAWTAEVLLSGTVAPTEGTYTELVIKGKVRQCTVVNVSSDYKQIKCRVVAGRGKLGQVLTARDYQGQNASKIAQDALQDAGEVPGAWSGLDVYCGHWMRRRGLCRETLNRLVRLLPEESQVVWRVLDDGTVDTVTDDFALAVLTAPIAPLTSWGQEKLLWLGVENSELVPGKSVRAWGTTRRLNRVIYSWGPATFQAKCYYM